LKPILYWLQGGADVAESRYRPFRRKGPLVRLIVRRVRPTPAASWPCSATTTTSRFITDRQGSTLDRKADHRHTEVEPAICDLKHGAA